jgi:hypothetical protein
MTIRFIQQPVQQQVQLQRDGAWAIFGWVRHR